MEEREEALGEEKVCSAVTSALCSFISVFYSEFAERSNYVGTAMTHAEADMKGLSWRIPAPSKEVDLNLRSRTTDCIAD